MSYPSNSDDAVSELYALWEVEELARVLQQEKLKDLFAEAKEAGHNPKALRSAFRRHFALKTESDDQRKARQDTDEDTELYLAVLARVPAREIIEQFDAETGEITDTAPTPHPLETVAADALSGSDDSRALGADLSETTNGGSDANDARLDREPVIDRRRQDRESEDPAHDLGAIARPANATVEPDHSNVTVAPPDTRTPIQKTMDEVAAKRGRPYCLRPEMCASSQARKHCFTCEKEHAEAEGFAP
jgi:uncharacterized protein (UPF0335 family)